VLFPVARPQNFDSKLDAPKETKTFVELNPMKLNGVTNPTTSESMSVILQSEIRFISNVFAFTGWSYIIFSIMLFGPWIIMLLYLCDAT
jgi:hypothetical protein